jgi:signal transduction histidine kinase
MWTDSNSDPGLAARPAGEPLAASYRHVTPDLVACYVARGRDLRAQAIARMARQGVARVRALFGHARRGERPHEAGLEDPLSILAGDFRSPLIAIRSSAEILRDNPDIDSVKRRRFVDIVLLEEARLEALVARLLDDSDSRPGSPVWRPGPDRSRLEQAHSSCP